jgi:hypothetical protein
MKRPENPFNRKDQKLLKNPAYKNMISPYESKYPQSSAARKKPIPGLYGYKGKPK